VALTVPSDEGLQRYLLPDPFKRQEKGASKAKVEAKGSALSWPEGVTVSWEGTVSPLSVTTSSEVEGVASNSLTGWRCWPTGEMDKGDIQLRLAGEKEDGNALGVHLSWDSWGHFNVQ
jgi:hypothetical protein